MVKQPVKSPSHPIHPFPVVAGVGDFNISWVSEAIDAVALHFETDINHFLSDSTTVFPTKPVVEGTTTCPFDSPLKGTNACQASYFIAGGLGLVTPWPARNETQPEETVYILHGVQGLQVDFTFAELGRDARFDGTKDCIVQGNNDAAVQFCVTKSEENVIYASKSKLSFLRNLLVLPLYYFSPLYFSPAVAAQAPLPDTMIKDEQKELYVIASLASPSYRVRVAPWSIWVYTFGGVFVLLSCLTILVLGSLSWIAGRVLDTTIWPVVDFVANCSDEKRGGDDGLIERLRMLHGKGSKEVKKALQDVRLYGREPSAAQNGHSNGVSV